MPIIRSPKPVRKPAKAKGVKRAKTVPKKAARTSAEKVAVKKTTSKKPVAAKPDGKKRPRAKVLNEHPDNTKTDPRDHEAVEALDRARTKAARKPRKQRRTAVDIAADPPQDQPPATSLVARVSEAIERELSKIERIIGNPTRVAPAQRIETESRARVLASLARTLKEVMRLREQERGDDNAKAADDDAVPRDLDEFRRELSRRLEGLVAGAAPLPAGGNDPG